MKRSIDRSASRAARIAGTSFSVFAAVAILGSPAVANAGGGGGGGQCGCMDIAFVVDDTGSMDGAIANVKAGLTSIIAEAQSASGGDLEMSVVSFKDTVEVDQALTSNTTDVQNAIDALVASGGSGEPESSAEGIRMAVSDATAVAGCKGSADGSHGLMRAECVGVVIMVTDAPPGGCDDNYAAGVDDVNAGNIADAAAAADIRIAAIMVQNGSSDAIELPIMQNYASTTNGSFVQTPSNGDGTATAIEAIIEGCGQITTTTTTSTSTTTSTTVAVCGDGIVQAGEDCDDGTGGLRGIGDDPCCAIDCTYETAGTDCDDGDFCNGTDTCDGAGTCDAGTPPDCDAIGGECANGSCNETTDSCDLTPINEGLACAPGDDCTLTATCQSGVCTAGSETVLSPSCRWLAVGGQTGESVGIRTDIGTEQTGALCADTGDRIRGALTGDLVATEAADTAIRFDVGSTVDGDIVTGGGALTSGTYELAFVPNTDEEKTVAGGVTQASTVDAADTIDTTGGHPLVSVCDDDQDKLDTAVPTLDGLAADQTVNGTLKIRGGLSTNETLDITGQGVYVLDVTGNLKIGRRATWNLIGGANDVLIVRVDGRLLFGFGADVGPPVVDAGTGEVTGEQPGSLLPENVLFYVRGNQCKVGAGAVGYGSFFCPDARRVQASIGSAWLGSWLGGDRGRRSIRFRTDSRMVAHEFTGQ